MSKRKTKKAADFGAPQKAAGTAEAVVAAGEKETITPNKNRLSRGAAYLKAHVFPVTFICLMALGVLGASLKYLDDDAHRQIRAGYLKRENKEDTLLNKINPFLPAPSPTPTPRLAKEYIYAGSRLLAVEDTNASAAPPADLAVFRPSTGVWWGMAGVSSQQFAAQFGQNGDVPVAGDYDGDAKTDLAVFRPSTNTWWILRSSDASFYSVIWGAAGDKLAQADYDGDSRTDIAVYRPSTGVWYIVQSSTSAPLYAQFGNNQDVPAPADYDGDGRADVAVWRSSATAFYSSNSSNGQIQAHVFGSAGDTAVAGDYDGDGRADVAVWRPSTANFYIKQSTNNTIVSYQIGTGTDIPVQNDYDGDGKMDAAVWRAAESSPGAGDVGKWFIRRSAMPSPLRVETWGVAGDIPIPAYYRR